MNLARVFLVLLVLSLHATALASTPEPTATVLFDIAIERATGETKVYLKADGVINDYRKVQLKKNIEANRPDRMYLDVKNVLLAGKIPAKQVGTALSQVRIAKRSDGFRVVFDSNLDELFDYTISAQPDGLLVTIREASATNAVIADIMQGEEPVAAPEPKSEGDLDLLIVAAESPEHAQEWLDSSADRKVNLKILKTAKPDQVINISFLATGVTPDSYGDFSVAVSFTLLDPSGKLVLSKRRFANTSGRAPANPAFILAEPVLSITLDGSDPSGEYTMIGIVEDLTNNKMVRTSLKIALEK